MWPQRPMYVSHLLRKCYIKVKIPKYRLIVHKSSAILRDYKIWLHFESRFNNFLPRASEPFCHVISHSVLMAGQLVMAVDRLPLHFTPLPPSRRKLPNHFIEWLLRKVSESPLWNIDPALAAHTRALFHPRCHNRLLFFGDGIQRGPPAFLSKRRRNATLAALEI